MRLRSEGLDIPRLECMIGPQTQIHVTDFQRLVRDLHSAHISPFYIRANRIWLHTFPPLRRNVLHAGKQMCVSAGWCLRVFVSACKCLCVCLWCGWFAQNLPRGMMRKKNIIFNLCCFVLFFNKGKSYPLSVCVHALVCLPLWGPIWVLQLDWQWEHFWKVGTFWPFEGHDLVLYFIWYISMWWISQMEKLMECWNGIS